MAARPTARFGLVESRGIANNMTNPPCPSCSPPHGNIEILSKLALTYEMSSKWYYGQLLIFKINSISGVGLVWIFSKIRNYIFLNTES